MSEATPEVTDIIRPLALPENCIACIKAVQDTGLNMMCPLGEAAMETERLNITAANLADSGDAGRGIRTRMLGAAVSKDLSPQCPDDEKVKRITDVAANLCTGGAVVTHRNLAQSTIFNSENSSGRWATGGIQWELKLGQPSDRLLVTLPEEFVIATIAKQLVVQGESLGLEPQVEDSTTVRMRARADRVLIGPKTDGDTFDAYLHTAQEQANSLLRKVKAIRASAAE